MSSETMSLRVHPPAPRRLTELPSPRGMRVRFNADLEQVDRFTAAWSRLPCADASPATQDPEMLRILVE